MVDTVRTTTDLLTNLFQDGQAANSITAQDMRDLIVSMKTPVGQFTLSASAATTISVAGTYVKCAGSTTLSGLEHLFTNDGGTNNRLKYTGGIARPFLIMGQGAFTCASNHETIAFTTAVNGTPESAVSRVRNDTGSNLSEITEHRVVTLNPNDYIEIWATNETSTASITVENFIYSVHGLVI